jgi:transposase
MAAENNGIAVYAVPEDYTSKRCAYHDIEVERSPRGLIHCPPRHTVHSDANAALNILKRGGKPPASFKA